ncbi:MAG: ankyrin repeat domain-containing protein [Acetobacter sp.]|nr:ankyrin repeat domain-containing protein [Acetobacter sp.]
MLLTHTLIMHRFFRSLFLTLTFCGLVTSLYTPTHAASHEQQPHSKALPSPQHKQLPPLPNEDDETSRKDIEPTTALFNAINRGDAIAAREAINRGADMNGHNILGQTPLDMSIDLNRNSITFLLLSLRDSDTVRNRNLATQQPTATQHTVSTHVSDLNKDSQENEPENGVDLTKILSSSPSPPKQHYDTSGGIARPEDGFLGFNGS